MEFETKTFKAGSIRLKIKPGNFIKLPTKMVMVLAWEKVLWWWHHQGQYLSENSQIHT